MKQISHTATDRDPATTSGHGKQTNKKLQINLKSLAGPSVGEGGGAAGAHAAAPARATLSARSEGGC